MPKRKRVIALFITLFFIMQVSFNIEKAEACCGITGMSVDASPSTLSPNERTTISGYINLWDSATAPFLYWRLTITGPDTPPEFLGQGQTVSVTYTPPRPGVYTYKLYAWETRYGTRREIKKTFTVVACDGGPCAWPKCPKDDTPPGTCTCNNQSVKCSVWSVRQVVGFSVPVGCTAGPRCGCTRSLCVQHGPMDPVTDCGSPPGGTMWVRCQDP